MRGYALFAATARCMFEDETSVNILVRPLAIALILLMQGPAMLVQEVAWMRMLVSYTQERGLKRGVVETFDGQHPCCLCEKAAKIREQEQPQDPTDKRIPEQGLRLICMAMIPAAGTLIIPVDAGRDISTPLIAAAAENCGRGADAPDSPPPRWA